MKKTRLIDIAKVAGVSEATVSLVLNNKPSRISQSKKNEIRKIAEEMNYRPNHLARSLSTQKSHTVGLIIPDIENPFFSTLSKQIEEIMREKGYLVFIVNSDDSFHQDIELIRELTDRQIDGLLICPSTESYSNLEKVRNFYHQIEIPFVLVDRVFEGIDFNQVSFDHEYGGYIATQYLIEEGCKEIACFTGGLTTHNGNQRYRGFEKAMNEANLKIDTNAIFDGDYRFETGYKFGKSVLEHNNIDGVFAFNDLMAYGLFKAMFETQTSSSKIKIVGYDNLKQSEMFGLPLTSVEQDINLLGNIACDQLLKQIDDENYKENTVLKPKIAA